MKNKLSIICLMVLIMGIQTSSLAQLVLWNKLGTPIEVSNSMVGPNGVITGSVAYVPCEFGNGVTGLDYSVNKAVFPGALPINQIKGTIEFWWKPSFNWNDNTGHMLFFFNPNGYPNGGNNQEFFLYKDAVTPGYENLIVVNFYDGVNFNADYRFHVNFSAGDIIHVGLTWDITAGARQKMKLYINGTAVTNLVYGGRDIVGSSFPACNLQFAKGGVDENAVIDNVKIYNNIKTDFSDRCSEDGSTQCTGGTTTNAPPTITLTKPALSQESASNAYRITWTDTDPGHNSTISLYYDNNDSGFAGTKIVSGISSSNLSYVWQISSLPEGTYYVYAVISDGIHPAVKVYASGSVKVISMAVKKEEPEVDVDDDVCKPGKDQKFNIHLNLPKEGKVTVEVYDIQGNRVATLVKDGQYDRGYHDINWDLKKDIGSGVYWITMKGDGWTKRKRVAIIK